MNAHHRKKCVGPTDWCRLTVSFKEHSSPLSLSGTIPYILKLSGLCAKVTLGPWMCWPALASSGSCSTIELIVKRTANSGQTCGRSPLPSKGLTHKTQEIVTCLILQFLRLACKGHLNPRCQLRRRRTLAPCWVPPPLQLHLSLANANSCGRALIYARQV